MDRRLLLAAAPVVTSVVADNRGEVVITAGRTLVGVSKSTVKLFTPGKNGAIGDADDVRQPTQVVYTPDNGRITIKGKLAAGTGYRVRIEAKRVTSTDGRNLDGEFSGKFPSGDGKPGGNFAFIARNDKGNTPSARISTSAGVIVVKLQRGTVKTTVNNFLDYANAGRYDGTIIHASGRGDQFGPVNTISGGGYTGTQTDSLGVPTRHIPTFGPIPLQATLPNIRGSIAMTRSSQPDSATSEWFFNQADNPFFNTSGNEQGYAVFGNVTSGIGVIDTIYNTKIKVVNDTFSSVPQINKQNIVVRRVAALDKIAPVV